MELVDNVVAPASAWATKSVCLLLNSTREFVKREAKIFVEATIICPNSIATTRLLWKTIKLRTISNSKLAWNNHIASLTSTRQKWVKHNVLAKTNAPSLSHKNITIPVMSNWFEKGIVVAFETSTLRALQSKVRRDRCWTTNLR